MAFLFDDDTNERHYLYEDDQTHYGGQKQLFDTDYVVVIPRKHVQDAHGGQYVQTGNPVKVICCVEGRAQQAGMFSISGAEDKTPSSDNPAVWKRSLLCRLLRGNGPATFIPGSGIRAIITMLTALLRGVGVVLVSPGIGRFVHVVLLLAIILMAAFPSLNG